MNKQIGILMPVASLPNRFGSGDFGPDAFHFIDDIKIFAIAWKYRYEIIRVAGKKEKM